MIRIFPGRVQLAAFVLVVGSLTHPAISLSKPHSVTFGKWISVPWSTGSVDAERKTLTLKVRPLLVDARVKEFILGPLHDVTDRVFVARRAFRVNDSLPQEDSATPKWQWQRGGWLWIDRITGHIAPINLPEFDALYSSASWYRDYAAYCSYSEDGKKVYGVVAQLTRRKPVLKKLFDGAIGPSEPTDVALDSACPVIVWQRAPIRVTFEPAVGVKQTFEIRGRVADLITEDDDAEETKN